MSVRKRSWVTASGQPRTVWQVDYRDRSGKRRARQFDKKRDADSFYATARVEVQAGTHVARADTVTVEAAGKLWLRSGEAAGLERSTLDQRRQHLEHHITPLIGNRLIIDITGPALRDFEDRLRAGGRSPAMCRKVRVSLGAIFGDAISRGLCQRNPVRETRAARSTATDKRHRRRLVVGLDIPEPAEIRAFLAALSGRWRPLLMTAVLTGLRASELRGLRWSDLDLKAGVLYVRQRADVRGKIGRPKSPAAERSVPVPPALRAVLTQWRDICPAGPLGLCFPNGAGRVENMSNIVQRGLVPTWAAAGVTDRYGGLHALRHFFASWCANRVRDGGLGLSLKELQERLGHSSLAMTADVYSHLFPRGDDDGELAAGEAALIGPDAT
jgi:integrase